MKILAIPGSSFQHRHPANRAVSEAHCRRFLHSPGCFLTATPRHVGRTGLCLIIPLLAILLCPRPALAQGGTLLTTFAKSAPVSYGNFGIATAAVGTDRVLIGANVENAAYLFSTDGSLLTVFTNPTPAEYDGFGGAVAAVGTDKVLIGAPWDDTGAFDAGSAYLLSTSGALLTHFPNPAPASGDGFGYQVAAVGNDRVLIAAYEDDAGARDAGSAYLFSTDGTLLTTFTNPAPSLNANFGRSLAAVGSDRVLIAASFGSTHAQGSGAAYLFGTDGTLLTTFDNPTPAIGDNFGTAVAAVGNDRVVITAPGDDSGATDAGSAYLFSTEGTLLVTFATPIPTASYYFGTSVAAVGSNWVVIGAMNDSTGADSAGVAWLFGTDGTLITTIPNPAPAAFGRFGLSVADAGNHRILIGAPGNSTGEVAGAGAAYLFDLACPPLNIARDDGSVVLTWLTAESGLILQQCDHPVLPASWSDTPEPVFTQALTHVVRQPIPTGTLSRFFRLRRP